MTPTAEELLKDNYLLIEGGKTCEAHTHLVVKQMVEFAKLHVKAALEEAASKLPFDDKMNQDIFLKKEILNCYPDERIK